MLRKVRRWLKPKKLLPVLAVVVGLTFLANRVMGPGGTGPGAVPDDAPVLSPGEAAAHVGEPAVVCGRVASTAVARGVRGTPTYLNFGAPYPDQDFTVIIWERYRANFDFAPERAYRDSELCVSGRIQDHEGVPQIEVRSPEQIRVGGP